jgi:single-strand DNA-binding protein
LNTPAFLLQKNKKTGGHFMMTINAVGRIVRDFELKKSEKNGCVYANFSLVVNEGFGDNKKETYFECTAFRAEAERLIKAKAKKGSQLQITGKFGTSEYTRKDGSPGHALTIIVLAWSYIPGTGGQKDANGGTGNGGTADNAQTTEANVGENPAGDDFPGVMNLDDDDLPF